MKTGDKVKVVKFRDGWEGDFDEEWMITEYSKCFGKVGTILFIELGSGFMNGLDEIEVEIEGKRDLYFYKDELELVEEAQ